ncbi:hypothetical protein LguiB_010530 [Lonicera macranthoides]
MDAKVGLSISLSLQKRDHGGLSAGEEPIWILMKNTNLKGEYNYFSFKKQG